MGLTGPFRLRELLLDRTGQNVTVAVPTGVLYPFAGSSAPTGYLLCNGTTASRTTYATLFATISTTYGVGDGSTTFGLPDMRGRVPMGAGTGNGQGVFGSGVITGAISLATRTAGQFGGDERLHSHSHDIQRSNIAASATGADASVVYRSVANTGSTYTQTQPAGLGGSDNLPPYVVLNYIIKT